MGGVHQIGLLPAGYAGKIVAPGEVCVPVEVQAAVARDGEHLAQTRLCGRGFDHLGIPWGGLALRNITRCERAAYGRHRTDTGWRSPGPQT